MILNPSDPTGLGLFSKCARNQAARLRSHRPASAAKPKPARSTDDHARKKVTTHYSFAKQQSRDQRQSKYRRDDTPPVGQYNPLQRQRPKLVWDILKAYHHEVRKKKPASSTENVMKSTQSITTPHSEVEGEEEPVQSMASLGSEPQMSVNRSQCMVNMSRMTGRKEETLESAEWGEGDIMQSVGYVRRHVAKNIYFAKQPREHGRRYDTINPASSYNYDYRILKPSHNGLLDFASVRGRDTRAHPNNQYAYQHYEYNSYVWQSNSHVYPNTKTHLIHFTKQTDRYARPHSPPPTDN